MAPAYRGRFAPSPTGPLHFGSLVAALASFCDARRHDGEWLVRIEDVDVPRSRAGAERAILHTLFAYGFRWDGDAVRQSERTSLYRHALSKLLALRVAYRCTCSRQSLARVSPGPIGERVYPGTCRDQARVADGPFAWRVRVDVPQARDVAFADALQGVQRQDLARDVGDFVVQRADGLYAYQLAVVVDDGAQGITHVVRGADLIASTPRQILLQRLLRLPEPVYLHVPVAIDREGRKLSKQTGAAPLADDEALPALLAAWRFLDQSPPPRIATIDAFWRFAITNWTRSRLPPVPMLPSPVGDRPARPV